MISSNITGGLFICWPVVPFFSFLNLLWTRPKNWKRDQSVDSDTTEAFDEAKRIATMTSGITGGIESPIQFALQVSISFTQLHMKFENRYLLPIVDLFDAEWPPPISMVWIKLF